MSDLRAAETLAAAIGLRVGLQIQEAMANPIACVRNSPPRRCPTRNPTRLAAPIRARRTMNDERTQHQIAALLSADDRLEPSRLSAIAATVGAHERTVPPERRTVPTPPPGRSVLSDERASGPAHTGRSPRTICERVVRPGPDDCNHWTKRARVSRRLGLLVVVRRESLPGPAGDARIAPESGSREVPLADRSARRSARAWQHTPRWIGRANLRQQRRFSTVVASSASGVASRAWCASPMLG
jgi:hypothetical protein